MYTCNIAWMNSNIKKLSLSQYSFLQSTHKGSGSWLEKSGCLDCGKKYLPL